MALGSGIVWEVRPGSGSDTTCSGGFDPSQTAGMFTDGAATSATGNAPVFTSASYSFVAGDVGAFVYIASGTNWVPGWYSISSVAGGAATLNATAGQSTLAPSGGAWLNPAAGCATTASPTGATWSIDYSQQNSAQVHFTDLAIQATNTQLKSTAHPFGAQWVGNLIQVTAGTGFTAGWYCITSVSSSTATMDRAVGTASSTSGTGYLGGAMLKVTTNLLLSSGSLAVAGNIIWQIGTQTVTSTVNITIPASSSALMRLSWRGYGTYRGDTTHAEIACSTNSVHGVTVGPVTGFEMYQIDVVMTAGTPGDAVRSSTSTYSNQITFHRCKFSGGNIGLNIPLVTEYTFCGCYLREVEIASSVSFGILTGGQIILVGCYIHGNGSDGLKALEQTNAPNPSITAIGCTFASNSGKGIYAADVTIQGQVVLYGCNFDSNTGDGVESARVNASAGLSIVSVNCIYWNNGGFGINLPSAPAAAAPATVLVQLNNAFGSNTSGSRASGIPSDPSDKALTGSPWVSPSTGDYSLNSTSGAGAVCTGAGFQSGIL